MSKILTGELKKNYNNLMECVDCETQFHVDTHGRTFCNGTQIAKCPWCRSDSKPWFAGRGK